MLKSKLLKSQFLTYEIQVQLDIHLGLFLRLAVSDSKMCRAGSLPFKECPANTAACIILPLQHSGYSHCMAGSRTPGAPRSEVPVHSVMCLLEEYTLWSSSLSLKYVQCSIFFIKTEPLLKHCAGDLRIGVYTPVEFFVCKASFLILLTQMTAGYKVHASPSLSLSAQEHSGDQVPRGGGWGETSIFLKRQFKQLQKSIAAVNFELNFRKHSRENYKTVGFL